MLVFKCKIKIFTIYQLKYILYHFKVNWIIKSKHLSFERNITLGFQPRIIFLSKLRVIIKSYKPFGVFRHYICDTLYEHRTLPTIAIHVESWRWYLHDSYCSIWGNPKEIEDSHVFMGENKKGRRQCFRSQYRLTCLHLSGCSCRTWYL